MGCERWIIGCGSKKAKSFCIMEFSLPIDHLPLDGPLLKLYGNLNIVIAFQVPKCSPWSTWAWQQKLGRQIDTVRSDSMFLTEEEKDVLESMEFKWGPKGRTPQRENKRHKSK